MTSKTYKVWKDNLGAFGRYHRYYGPAFSTMNLYGLEVQGVWWLHGRKIK